MAWVQGGGLRRLVSGELFLGGDPRGGVHFSVEIDVEEGRLGDPLVSDLFKNIGHKSNLLASPRLRKWACRMM